MKRLGWLLAFVLAALLIASLASPGSLAGIALRRAGQALGQILSGPVTPADGEAPVEAVPGQRVPAEVIPWE